MGLNWTMGRASWMHVANIFFGVLFGTTSCLKITEVRIPSHVAAGDSAWFECRWDEQGEKVYSLKWYWGLNEFYRWTPAARPDIQVFPINSAFIVDQEASTRGHVRVTNITMKAEDILRCEISAEAPSFHTDSQTARLRVVDLPDSRPFISGVKAVHRLHEQVVLNCTSPLSKPAAKLTFYVNDEKADPNWLTHYKPYVERGSNLETAVLGLRFRLQPQLIRGNVVVVKCSANLYDVYYESGEVYVTVDLPQRVPMMEGRASIGNGGPLAISKWQAMLTVVSGCLFRLLLK